MPNSNSTKGPRSVKISVKLFAAAKQFAETDVLEVTVPEPVTIAAIRVAMIAHQPRLAPILRAALFAVNAEYVGTDFVVPTGAEVACIPPVSGG